MLPKAVIERIARKAGVDRISAEAIEEIQKTIDDVGLEIARESAAAAKHAKRKTIEAEDIRIVSRK